MKMTKMNNYPWGKIALPDKGKCNMLSARRCRGAHYYWGLCDDGYPCFIIQYSESIEPQTKEALPRLSPNLMRVQSTSASVIIFLKDHTLSRAFFLLCENIVFAVGDSDTALNVYEKLVQHLSEWHRLFAGRKKHKLSHEQQMGLIAELDYLETYLFSKFGIVNSLKMWTGPLGRPKDFEVGRYCVEAKATGGSSSPAIKISSEDQLDTNGIAKLYLYVCSVSSSSCDGVGSFNLESKIEKVFLKSAAEDPVMGEFFLSLVYAVGYSEEDDYSNNYWTCSEIGTYLVENTFPRIISSNLPNGIFKVKYCLQLASLEKYRVDVLETTEG